MALLFLKNIRLVLPEGISAPTQMLIEDGIIQSIGQDIAAPRGAVHREMNQAYASVGWIDVGVQVGEPGFEHRETLQTVARAAAVGGFTEIVCQPNTHPVLHSKTEIQYILNKTAGGLVTFHPLGAISQDAAGKDLAELFDMRAAGAVAFSDGIRPVQDAGLLLRALQYVQAFNGLIINTPLHKNIAANGQMHEGVVSTKLGLKGIPALAEELMVQRDLSLLAYAGGRLHVHLLSTATSTELVRQAKRAGLQVTASVAVANLCATDERLTTFDTNWKVMPPLRSETDRLALLEGLTDGTIDFVCSNHVPLDAEAKQLEFPYAEFGMTGLETAFALCRTFLNNQLTINKWIEVCAVRPRQILGIAVPEIKLGQVANLTLFNPDEKWVYSEENINSGSKNSPYVGSELRGRVLGVVHGRHATFF